MHEKSKHCRGITTKKKKNATNNYACAPLSEVKAEQIYIK